MNPDRSLGQRFSTAIAYVIIAATGFAVFSLIIWGIVAIWVVILVVSVPLLLLPWLQWYMHTYTITTKRIITRSGIISRVGHDLPLTRISDIQLDKDVTDRFFGCGTLALQTSADDPLLLHDVPQVEKVQVEISNLIFNDTQGAIDADPRS